MRPATLCLLVKEGEILLAMKKRGFGVGKWNGVGGKPSNGETVKQAALREMAEEIGVAASLEDLEERGWLKFYFKKKPDWNQQVHIFLVRNWQGEPRETEEMRPKWYKHRDIPFDEMWPDDKYWLPLVLNGKKLEAEFHFNDEGDGFDKFNIREV